MLEVSSQLSDHSIAPLRRFDLPADVSPDLPVQFNQLGIDCLYRSLPGSDDQLRDFVKICTNGRRSSAEVILVKALLFSR